MPSISIVIPTFNRADLLEKALSSVLEQDFDDFEVVVSDNCSTDCTRDVMAKYDGDARVRYGRNATNIGMVGNWRHAILNMARADWFILMSDDDYFIDRTYLSEVAQAIRKHKVGLVYAGGVVRDTGTNVDRTLTLPFSGLVSGLDVFKSRGTLKPQDLILCNIAFRRADTARLGFFNNENNLSCDSELFLKLCLEGPVYAVPRPVCVYLKHGANLIYRGEREKRYLIGNLDYLINPYQYALQLRIPDGVASEFLGNARIRRYVGRTFLKLFAHHPADYKSVMADAHKKAPQLVDEIERHWFYRLLKGLIKLCPSPFLRRFPMGS